MPTVSHFIQSKTALSLPPPPPQNALMKSQAFTNPSQEDVGYEVTGQHLYYGGFYFLQISLGFFFLSHKVANFFLLFLLPPCSS